MQAYQPLFNKVFIHMIVMPYAIEQSSLMQHPATSSACAEGYESPMKLKRKDEGK